MEEEGTGATGKESLGCSSELVSFTSDIPTELVSYKHSWISFMVVWGLELEAK